MTSPTRSGHPSRNRAEPGGVAPIASLLLLAALLLGGAGPAAAERPPMFIGAPQIVVAAAVDSLGKEYPVLDVSVPYRALVFRRDDGIWRSGIAVTAVAGRDGRRVGGGVGRAAVSVDGYADTRGDGRVVCRVPLKVRGDGPVELKVVTRVLETVREWRQEMPWTPGRGRGLPWFLAGVDWNLPESLDAPRLLGDGLDTLRVAIDLGRRAGVPAAPADLILTVRAPDRDAVVVSRSTTLPAAADAAGNLRRSVGLPAAAMGFGRRELHVELRGEGGGPEHSLVLDPPRGFVNLRLDWDDDDAWRLHVGWLERIVDGETRGRLRDLPPAERSVAWDAMWRNVESDPAHAGPGRREHLLRIIAADARFGRFGRGALGDRGRTYILYGPPDRVEPRGDDLAYGAAWEIWYYRAEGLVFNFYDAHGMGDYRLHSTQIW